MLNTNPKAKPARSRRRHARRATGGGGYTGGSDAESEVPYRPLLEAARGPDDGVEEAGNWLAGTNFYSAMLPPPPRSVRKRQGPWYVNPWAPVKLFAVLFSIGIVLVAAGSYIHSIGNTKIPAMSDPFTLLGWFLGGAFVVVFGFFLIGSLIQGWLESRLQKELIRSGLEVKARIVGQKNTYDGPIIGLILEYEIGVGDRYYFREVSATEEILNSREGQIRNHVPALYLPGKPMKNRLIAELGYEPCE
jgi:hypothetical protein